MKVDGILVAQDGTIGRNVFFERIRRITGYLVGDVRSRFNNGKRAEEHDRVKHVSFLSWEERDGGWGKDLAAETRGTLGADAYPRPWPALKEGDGLAEKITAIRIRGGAYPQKECGLSLLLRQERGKAAGGEGSPAPALAFAEFREAAGMKEAAAQ